MNNAFEELETIKEQARYIKYLKHRITELRAKADGATARRAADEAGAYIQTSKHYSGAQFETLIDELEALETELLNENDKYFEHRSKCLLYLDALPEPLQMELTYYRYFCFYSWDQIAKITGMSRNYLYIPVKKARSILETIPADYVEMKYQECFSGQ